MHAQIHTIAFSSIETIVAAVQIYIALGLSGDAVACIGRVIAFNRIPCQRRNVNA